MNQCFDCEELATVSHHVVPVVLGGKATVRLCQECHEKVHDLNGSKISLSELVKIGLQKAKERGVKLGRKRLLTKEERSLVKAIHKNTGMSLRKIAEIFGTVHANISRIIRSEE